jgi:hypothetical protein
MGLKMAWTLPLHRHRLDSTLGTKIHLCYIKKSYFSAFLATAGRPPRIGKCPVTLFTLPEILAWEPIASYQYLQKINAPIAPVTQTFVHSFILEQKKVVANPVFRYSTAPVEAPNPVTQFVSVTTSHVISFWIVTLASNPRTITTYFVHGGLLLLYPLGGVSIGMKFAISSLREVGDILQDHIQAGPYEWNKE